jgi:hypothetical protein
MHSDEWGFDARRDENAWVVWRIGDNKLWFDGAGRDAEGANRIDTIDVPKWSWRRCNLSVEVMIDVI